MVIPPSGPDLEPGLLGQLMVRTHSDSQDHERRVELLAVVQFHGRRQTVAIRDDSLECGSDMHLHVVSLQFLLQRLGHLTIQQRQHLRLQFDQRHCQTAPRQLLHHLQPDEAGANHHRLLRPAALIAASMRSMSCRLRSVNTFGASTPLIGGTIGLRSGRQNQLAVPLLVGRAVRMVLHGDRAVRTINAHDLLPRAHVQAEPATQEIRRRHQQLVAVGDLAAQIVRQSAIGERDVFVLLKQDDLRLFVQPPSARRRRSTSGHAPHNHDRQR